MTGFGKAEITTAERKITVETRSLNGKQLDLSVKMPARYRQFEYEVRNKVAKELQRGKVDLFSVILVAAYVEIKSGAVVIYSDVSCTLISVVELD